MQQLSQRIWDRLHKYGKALENTDKCVQVKVSQLLQIFRDGKNCTALNNPRLPDIKLYWRPLGLQHQQISGTWTEMNSNLFYANGG